MVLFPVCPSISVYFWSASLPQLSQTGASLDNRVPTPASTASADPHSQHALADLPTASEPKPELRHDEQDFHSSGLKMEPKMEVQEILVVVVICPLRPEYDLVKACMKCVCLC